MYIQWGDGAWRKVSTAPRCRHRRFTGDHTRCVGSNGHAGPHWYYNSEGWLILSKNRSAPSAGWKWAAGMDIPPGHPQWQSPVDRASLVWSTVRSEEIVTDERLIRRLNAGHVPRGSCVSRPVSLEDPPPNER